MSINQEKFSNLNKLRKDTHKRISNLISQLNASTTSAMKQQAYMHKNPDSNGAPDLIPVVTPDFLAAAEAFNEVVAKLMDMQSVQASSMTVDEFIAKYSINLEEFSAELI